MEDRESILKRQAAMTVERALEEPVWKQIAAFVRPKSQKFDVRTQAGRMDTSGLFDSTGLYALDSFASGIFGQLTNPANRWLELGIDDQDLKKFLPVKNWFYEATNILLSSASPNSSNFYAQIPASLADLGAFGLGTMYQEESGNGRFIDRAIPLRELYIEIDANGELCAVHRRFLLKGMHLKRKFGPAARDANDDTSYTIIHSVTENRNVDFARLDDAGKAWSSSYIAEELQSFRVNGGYHEMPYAVALWSQESGSTYPIGPGHLARPDLATLNEMERAHLTAAQFAAEPIILVNDDSVVTAADFVPNNVLYGTMNDQGKQLLQSLSRSADIRLSMEQSQQRRKSIENAFYFSMMQLIDRPQMTATEFNGFQEEQLRLMAPNLARIQSGLLFPWITRRFSLLQRAGRIPPPPQELEGHELKIEIISPLAKVQKLSEGRATMQIVNGILGWAQADPSILDNIDFDAASRSIHDAFGGVPGLLRDPKQVEAIRQSRAQASAQQNQLAQTEQAVSIAAEAAHAQQASSRANERSQVAA